jgi:hypothetical protein
VKAPQVVEGQLLLRRRRVGARPPPALPAATITPTAFDARLRSGGGGRGSTAVMAMLRRGGFVGASRPRGASRDGTRASLAAGDAAGSRLPVSPPTWLGAIREISFSTSEPAIFWVGVLAAAAGWG